MKLVMAIPALFLFSVCILSVGFAQNSNQPTAQTPNQPEPIPLWANGAPGAKGDAPEDVPSVQLYQPPADKASGAAIVVCPGGGYGHLARHEGHDIAVWLNGIGVTAVVLKYRLGPKYQHPAMMQDALRAIRYTRSKASEWKIDPNRVGVIGFSAGGHLASTAATQFNVGDPNASDPVEKLSSRPDLAILCYPVVTMTDPFAHKGSRRNLLGENPPRHLIDRMSSEKQVTDKTPPTFLFHTGDDSVVPVENSLMFALALRKKKIPYELLVYEHGPHGVGLATDDPALNKWPRLLENWLRARGFVNQSRRVSESAPAPAKPRNPELVRLIDELRSAPPEFAADSMIKLSPHPEIDDAWKAEILEEAFRIAFDAQHPYKLKHLSESQVENRTGYRGLAFDLKMDRQSLQLLAILSMVRLDPKKARLLWGEMQKPILEPLKCEEALIYDVGDYYRAMVEMARRAFTREEMRIGEEIQFVEQHIVNIASPAEVVEAALAIMDLNTTPDQFHALSETYSRALENVANDNRTFWFYADKLSAAALALAGECERRGFPGDFLLARYRDYLVRQLSAPRCADNLAIDGKSPRRPEFVTNLNAVLRRYEYIPKIADDDIKPRKIDRAASFYPYWATRRARSLFEKIQVLRFGRVPRQTTRAKSNEPPEPLPYEARQASEWQYKLSDFLREMAEWKPEHEASRADYIHQKCRLFNELIELSPNSDMRLRMLDEYMAFLEQNRFECESFIDWRHHVSDLLRRVVSMREEEKKLALQALRYSNDLVLQLSIKLIPVFEAALQTSR
ncbi:MAG TPA: alpha/beta hydrolase [Blastocatellia bacterium]|nr:alpha/beta hydrolase [Blastocatellia bacterium]